MSEDETRALKKGSAETVILAVLEEAPLHGYGIAKRVEELSGGDLAYHAASLYPILYRLEEKGLIEGEWDRREGERRRRRYRLTGRGKKALERQRIRISSFIDALARVTGIGNG